MTLQHRTHKESVDLEDLNALARAAGLTRRVWFDAASWNSIIDELNTRRPIDTEPLPRIRKGSILTSDAWNRVVDRIMELNAT